MEKATDEPKILFFDIEASGLVADFAMMLCCGFKFLHEKKPFVIDIEQYPGKKPTDDSKLVAKVADIINSADVIVSYYGNRFDIPFINTRLLKSDRKKLIALPDASHVDLWRTARYKLKLHSNRLASVIDFLELNNKKTPVKGPQWLDAMAQDRNALKYIVDHCKADVLALEEAYMILRPLIAKHPRIRPVTPQATYSCPNCGSVASQSKGLATTTSGFRKQRRICKDCGHPFFGKVERLSMVSK